MGERGVEEGRVLSMGMGEGASRVIGREKGRGGEGRGKG